jgi:ribosomal protein S18 acetylase RimI-like enzyme
MELKLTLQILDKTHIRTDFNCGHSSSDNYIKNQASQDVKRNLSVCRVLCGEQDKVVVGYYTLSSHSIPMDDLPADIAKNLPWGYKDVPTALLGRLAIDNAYKGQRLGKFLLLDALHRCADLSERIGTMAVIVDPINGDAVGFYKAYGFINLPDSKRMFIPAKTIKTLQSL